MLNQDNTKARLTKVVDEIKQRGIDITAEYNDWMRIGFACASLGEQGRDVFHAVSSMHSDYNYDEIGAALEVKEIQRQRRDMLHGLELYYRAVFLHQDLDLEAWQLE